MKTIALFFSLTALLWVVPAHAAEERAVGETMDNPTTVQLRPSEKVSFGLQLGVTLGAGVVSVPLALGLATWLGSLSNSLIWSALPSLLSMALIPPTLTTLVAWWLGNWVNPGRFGFWAPWVVSCAVNVVALIVGGFAGISVGVPVRLLLFSVIDGVLVGGASAATMRLWAERARPPIPSFSPGISPTHVVTLGKVSF
ncbi:MAG: hypothetical protein ACT4TC_25700 [Myxococcaceae bacterium]